MSYQLVGGVMAYQGGDCSRRESATGHIGTETLPGHLRVAAATNIPQWTQV